jgi:type IV pilus assembly protein PilE
LIILENNIYPALPLREEELTFAPRAGEGGILATSKKFDSPFVLKYLPDVAKALRYQSRSLRYSLELNKAILALLIIALFIILDGFMTSNKSRGFTLLEIMIVVAIVVILTAIALPSYQDYLKRAKIMPAIQVLSEKQTRMEQCYQDHQGSYAPTPACAVCPSPDDATYVIASTDDFDFTCEAAKSTFTLTATGKGSMAGFTYTVNQVNTRTSTIADVSDRWNATSANCWITGKGGQPCQ